MKTVRFTTAQRIVPSGKVHGRQFAPGDTSDDPQVVAAALRNGWAVDVTSPAKPSALPVGDATASAHAAAAGSAASHPEPKPVKARKAAPENK